MTTPQIRGLGHLDLTVTDGDRTVRWWEQVMGFKLLVRWEQPGYQGWTMLHPSGLAVTAVTHREGEALSFDERRVGLDHVAFYVGDLAVLEAWAEHLDEHGVSHSGIQDLNGGRGGPLIVPRDPDNIQIELTAGWQPPGPVEAPS
jgi:catechol 2,3-dioxygenase-like lactoylglutathione lyase family enzyme